MVTIANVLAWALIFFPGTASLGIPTSTTLPDRLEVALMYHSLHSQIESDVANLDGSYGIAAVSLENGSSVSINAHTIYPSASMYKLLVMYRVFQQLDRGRLTLEDTLTITEADVVEEGADDSDLAVGEVLTVGETLEAMITVSSNAAAYALARQVGGWDEVTSAAAELGMDSTTLADGFVSTPADMLHFFELLAGRKLVSPEASDQMLSLLLRQQVNDRIPAQLPPGTYVAHKTGELDDVRNDGGIVFGPRGRYILVMMSGGITPADAVQVEAEISKAVYDQFGS